MAALGMLPSSSVPAAMPNCHGLSYLLVAANNVPHQQASLCPYTGTHLPFSSTTILPERWLSTNSNSPM